METLAFGGGFDRSCVISFNMDAFPTPLIGHLEFSVDYPPGRVSFSSAAAATSCQSGLAGIEHSALFSSDDSSGRLSVIFDSVGGFPAFASLATCQIRAVGVPSSQDFSVTVISELDLSSMAVLPQVPVGLLAIDCVPLPTTTTTTLPLPSTTTTTSTTTTVPAAWCSRPVSRSSVGSRPVASDCLFILRAAVGLQGCSPECICRPTGNLAAAGPTASDSLLCLKLTVGGSQAVSCPCAALNVL